MSKRTAKILITPMHRCLLVNEIVCLIFEFIKEWDEYPPQDGESKWSHTEGKRTLASLARTCRTFKEPALDALWMKLDSLDPLIRVLPRRMWAKRRWPLAVQTFVREKHWLTFNRYAKRVKFLNGPCWQLLPCVQHSVISALAKFPEASLPLLPNLSELVWSECKMSNIIEPGVSLLKYFAGPGVTNVSLFLLCWPYHVPEADVLSNLSVLCPNVTSFTAFFPRSSYNDSSREIGEIVSKWKKLRTLRSCALPQSVMDQLTSRQCLESLSIELNNSTSPLYVGKFPETLHKFSLGGNSAPLCTRYLECMHGSPESCNLRVGADESMVEDIEALFRILPLHLDKSRLRSLTIELTSSYWSALASETFPLALPLITPLLSFHALRELDLDLFSASGLDDAAYERMAKVWTGLRCLKVGTGDVLRLKPGASFKAVISLLTYCTSLEVLHVVFDGTIAPPPSPHIPALQAGEGGDVGGWRRGKGGGGGREGWGVCNKLITQLHVGHSPIVDAEVVALCLGSLMPRLKQIGCAKYPLEEVERWSKVQTFLARS
ncbi:hypothetical protein PAXRUDRAFT_834947 [Paxillus rubicundulus Ve08.2h10]|uniref:F-box domain-containing protein n=1 Tax=Paxillus rubicundulus Ve08.2h10 TaxID=930991 RepID=A0A0D0CQG4_9AGAM|nr:hypothetical protein PAXRUDRAFT_834947 [Paxillus rubicundulus Ve08.2h10]